LDDFNPLNAFQSANTVSGCDLWHEANCDLISAQATKDQEASGDPPNTWIGYFRSAEKHAWESLDDEEKEAWAADASQSQTSPEKSYTSPHIVQ